MTPPPTSPRHPQGGSVVEATLTLCGPEVRPSRRHLAGRGWAEPGTDIHELSLTRHFPARPQGQADPDPAARYAMPSLLYSSPPAAPPRPAPRHIDLAADRRERAEDSRGHPSQENGLKSFNFIRNKPSSECVHATARWNKKNKYLERYTVFSHSISPVSLRFEQIPS